MPDFYRSLALILCMIFAGSSTGAPVIARYIRISIPKDSATLSLAEVEVFSKGKNIALNGAAAQSSTQWDGDALRAIDGNTDGIWESGSVTHSAENTPNPFWELDLGFDYPIEKIIVWNRIGVNKNGEDLSRRLDGFIVTLADSGRTITWEDSKRRAEKTSNIFSVDTSFRSARVGKRFRLITEEIPGTRYLKGGTHSNFNYELQNGEAVIRGYTGPDVDKLVIPAQINGIPVVKVGGFGKGSFSSVIISEGVKEIDDWAFSNCPNLRTVSLPKSLIKIRSQAFRESANLRSINIPSSVTQISAGAFTGCESLDTLLNDSRTILVWGGGGKSGEYTIPSCVEIINDSAFEGTGFSSVIVPEGITYIGSFTFSNSKALRRVTLPRSITRIYQQAFSGCPMLKEVIFSGNKPKVFYDGCFSGSPNCTVYYSPIAQGWRADSRGNLEGHSVRLERLGSQGNSVFRSPARVSAGSATTEIVLTDYQSAKKQAIENNLYLLICFTASDWNEECMALDDLIFSTAEWKSYSGNRYVRVVADFPSDKTLLTPRLQQQNQYLKTKFAPNADYPSFAVINPKDEKMLGLLEKAGGSKTPTEFINRLTQVIVPPTTQPKSEGTIGIYTYTVTDGEVEITKCKPTASGNITVISRVKGYPVTAIGEKAFAGCNKLTGLVLPDTLKKIDAGAFAGCNKLRTVTLPDALESIGNNAFIQCTALSEITIPAKCETFGNAIFLNCTNLGVVITPDESTLLYVSPVRASGEYKIPSGITRIAGGAFAACRMLQGVQIPYGMVTIGDGAFLGCSQLSQITIPETVTEIGDRAFADCPQLKRIVFRGDVPDCPQTLFQRSPSVNAFYDSKKSGWAPTPQGQWEAQGVALRAL